MMVFSVSCINLKWLLVCMFYQFGMGTYLYIVSVSRGYCLLDWLRLVLAASGNNLTWVLYVVLAYVDSGYQW